MLILKPLVTCISLSCMSFVTITTLPYLDKIANKMEEGTEIFGTSKDGETNLNSIDFNSFRKMQSDFDKYADVRDLPKFDLQIDEIEKLKDAKSVGDLAKNFDVIMEKFGIESDIKVDICKPYLELTGSEIKAIKENKNTDRETLLIMEGCL